MSDHSTRAPAMADTQPIVSDAPETQPGTADDNRRFPLWVARRWYLYRLHRGSTILALASTLLIIAALIPLTPIDLGAIGSPRVRITTVAAAGAWIVAIFLIARATRLLISGMPEHRHSATRLALGVIVPGLGGLGAASAGVALIAFLLEHNAIGGLWTGVASIFSLLILALALWACADTASASPPHPRTPWVTVTVNLAVILVLIVLAVLVLAVMAVLTGVLAAWIASIAITLIAILTTLSALSTRAIIGAIILAREVAELGPEIEPVSGP